MLFSSNVFLFLFLPAALAGYYLLNKPYRNFFLLCMSLLFYAWGEPRFIIVMAGSVLWNFTMALRIDRFHTHKALCKAVLILCVTGNLGLLFTFKYLDFFIAGFNQVMPVLQTGLGLPAGAGIPLKNLALPLGISFFTFQAMSYVIDVYRRTVGVQRNLIHLALYISFFPQLVAGPIVRYQDIESQIENRKIDLGLFGEGVHRFIMGLSKKVLLANNMALVADHAFALPDGERSVIYAWLGALAYALQILFDFSGYSDMAIGLGKMFGFHFLENFNYPYISASISEFWRRWHISMGQWFRDYVYFSLGGSRVKSKARLVFNLFIVWILTGIWHGAGWNFIWWGLLFFVLITFEKFTGYPQKCKTVVTALVYRIFTLLAVLGGWVLFRAEGMGAAAGYGLSMLGFEGNAIFCDFCILTIREYWLFFLAALLCSTDLSRRFRGYLDGIASRGVRFAADVIHTGFYMFCFAWSVSFLILGAHNPFIYFNF